VNKRATNTFMVITLTIILTLIQAGCGGNSIAQNGNGVHVLRYNNLTEPAELDPQKMSEQQAIGVGQLVYEGLMVLDEKLEVVPGAAEHMDVSVDGLIYTLTLRDGLKYSDGTPLTAKNFEYAWKRLFDPRVTGRVYASVAFDIAGAEELDSTPPTDTTKIEQLMKSIGIKATDDKHIQFTLKNKASYFPYILTLPAGWPTREDLVEKGGDKWTTDEKGTYYIGNGPFILKELNPQEMRLEANPLYRTGKPKLNELIAIFNSDREVSFQAYKKGELDVLNPLGSGDLAAVLNDPTLKSEYTVFPGSCSLFVGFNVTIAPFDNIKVRQAFAQALDRQDYVDTLAQGNAKAALSYIPPNRPGYAPDIKIYPYNPEEAKQTLTDAGFPDARGLPPIKITYPDSSQRKTRMEWFQNQFKKNLNVDITLDPVESKTYASLINKPSTIPQFYGSGYCQNYPDPHDWLSIFTSNSGNNPSNWKNAEYDSLIKQADQESDQVKRLSLYNQAQEILIREAPIVNTIWDVNPVLIKPYVVGMREYVNPQDQIIPGFFNITNIDVESH
jgi:oligopeptide transport system substrate-binding protein